MSFISEEPHPLVLVLAKQIMFVIVEDYFEIATPFLSKLLIVVWKKIYVLEYEIEMPQYMVSK